MFAAIHRLSMLHDDRELTAAVDALRSGAVIAFPADEGMLLACHGDLPESVETLARFSGAQPELLLVGGEWFRRVFPAPDALTKRVGEWFAADGGKPFLGATLARLPHSRFERGLWIRATVHPLAGRLVALAGVPVMVSPASKDGRVLEKAGDLARAFRSGVEVILDGGRRKPAEAPPRMVLMRAGIALSCSTRAEARETENAPLTIAIERAFPRRIMFVCLGNINRSAFLEARLKAVIDAESIEAARAGYRYVPAYLPESSGTIAMPGNTPPDPMLDAAALHGCEERLREHRARPYTPELAEGVDMIVPLARNVSEALRSYAVNLERIISFPRQRDLPDPMGGGADDYLTAAGELDAFLSTHFLSKGCALLDPVQSRRDLL